MRETIAGMADAASFTPHEHCPATFVERGVWLPCTTPALLGSRVRLASRGHELIVPHPMGGGRVYVLAWSGIDAFCVMTLHDRVLTARLADLRVVTPGTVREVAMEVAMQGLAGPEAEAAFVAARQRGDAERLRTHLWLLGELSRQLRGDAPVPATRAALEVEARAVIRGLAAASGREAPAIAGDIEALADLYAPLGLGEAAHGSRLSLRRLAIDRLGRDIGVFLGRGCGAAEASGYLVMTVAQVTLAITSHAIAAVRELTADLPALLRQWAAAPESLSSRFAAAEWLLDGWEQMCPIWDLAEDDAARGLALHELALAVPLVPREAEAWLGVTLPAEAMASRRATVRAFEDWGSGGLVIDLIARNERVLALAA